MTNLRPDLTGDLARLPRMPAWVTAARPETPEDVAFLSGAALAALDIVLRCPDLPYALLRERLALRAAEACVAFLGRPERAAELRDEVHLLRPGEQPGPSGAIYQQWQRAVARQISVANLQKALPQQAAEDIAAWLDRRCDRLGRRGAGQGGPVAPVGCASAVLETVLAAAPREETAALILADATLAQALGWDHLVPLLSAGLKSRDLRKSGDDLRLACHKAVLASAGEALRIATDLSRRSAQLKAIAPKLRARGAGEAVELFLIRDALSPSVALTDPALGVGMSDRAARRFCDRLLELGAVRELTGRDSFRLYGV